ncbi:MAG: hypothetical protein ACFFB3_19870 [Candidatus Hodarchaeota archaeon]
MSRSHLQLKASKESLGKYEKRYETLVRFKSTEYENPSNIPQRPNRWYNGSIMGNGGGNSTLFGPNGRLRSLHTRITSQETPGSQPRSRLYRLVGDILSQFFPFEILDPLIEELTTSKSIRLPQAIEEAVCIVLAAVEMFLRKCNRTILKEKVISEIGDELGMDIDRKKIAAAKWFLARGGFWKDHLHEISTATYEILQNLTLEIITSYPFPVQENSAEFRRQLFHRCMLLINHLSETRRRPQNLEIYAHVLVSLAAESLLNSHVLTSDLLGDSHFNTRVHRAKRQFFEMLEKKQRRKPRITQELLAKKN